MKSVQTQESAAWIIYVSEPEYEKNTTGLVSSSGSLILKSFELGFG